MCSGQNSPNSCHFSNNESVFLQVLHYSSLSWDITLLYFFSWNCKYVQQKEPIKVKIRWNFIWIVESPNQIKFQLKKYQRVISHDNKEWCKVWRKTDLWFWIWHEEFIEFSPNHSKVWKFLFDGLFLSKVYKF